jgi:hypothetical protein
MTLDVRTVRKKSDKIGVWRAAFVYLRPFTEAFSTGTREINEVVLVALPISVSGPLVPSQGLVMQAFVTASATPLSTIAPSKIVAKISPARRSLRILLFCR